MDSGLHITLKADTLFSVFGFPVTNATVDMWVVIALLLGAAWLIGRSLKLTPGKLQAGVESFFEYLLGMMEQTLGTRKLAERYFPLIATIFIFILGINLFGFIPVIGDIGFRQPDGSILPLFHTATADLNTTLALAIISFAVIELSGILTLGVLKYGSKFVNFRGGAIAFAVGILEIVGNLARLISFSFRLFGAIFAGEVLLLVITHFLPYIASVPFMAFEAFIGLLQAAVFAILTMAFIKIAIDEPHGSHASH